MNRRLAGICLLGLGLIASLGISRFPASSAPISVQHVGTSPIGKFLTHEVTKEIAANQELHVGGDAEDGWKIVLLTSDGQGTTFYSVVLVRKQFEAVFDQYVFSFQGICPAERLQLCAREIVGKVREPISQFEADWEEMSTPDADGGRQRDASTTG